MKKETPFLDFYYRCMKTGKIPTKGLCEAFAGNEIYGILDYRTPWGYWGYNGHAIVEQQLAKGDGESYVLNHTSRKQLNIKLKTVRYKFTTLRQTVVLLCAALNGEL